MNKSKLSLIALTVLCFAAALPAAAISPSVSVPKTATSAVSAGTAEIKSGALEGHSPAYSNADCRAQHRAFVSRNTVKPSDRRRAIAACDETVAATKPAN